MVSCVRVCVVCRAIVQDESRRGAAVVEEPLAGRRVRVEEAVARLFEHCRDLAGGPDEVAEVVVTVPPYYTFAQRRLLAQTLRLAGLEPLVLVNDLTAGACPTFCAHSVLYIPYSSCVSSPNLACRVR